MWPKCWSRFAPPKPPKAPRSRSGCRRLPFPESSGDELAADTIQVITSGDRAGGDSLHLLVMDMHRALNALQANLASETITAAAPTASAMPTAR